MLPKFIKPVALLDPGCMFIDPVIFDIFGIFLRFIF